MSRSVVPAWRLIRHRVGRRGAFLGFLALLDYGYALSLWPYHVPRHMTTILPVHAWACIWLAVAIACTVGIFMRRDRVAYTMASGVKAMWGALYVHLSLTGFPQAWISAVVWLAFSLLVVMVSSWPDPVFTELAGKGR